MSKAIIDGLEVLAENGQTILEACRQAGIFIPTLCHDDKLKPLGSCQMCVVELHEHGLVASCATPIADRMIIKTDSPRVVSTRRRFLESLVAEHYGDCVAPCQRACPAAIDIQGYIALIARGAYREAVELIKETLPLPAVIGRICPHPCEDACRRNLVDEPVAICAMKRFAADCTSRNGQLPTTVRPKTGHKVAIVGSGPAGLSAAYYLAKEGREVTIFEALPKPGGMLRYGIPDYRLPKQVLDEEIKAITEMGVAIKVNQCLGRDFSITGLLEDGFHAVFLGIGAHQNQRMNVEGEDLQGVLPGTSFLRSVASGEQLAIGRRIVVIGGGNTAIDAARTALRVGAEEVTIIYRRSRTEMPAAQREVEEAEEEGIGLHLLAAPVRITGENGRVSAIECVRMVLGEPDASGRRRPEPVSGSEFVLPCDSVIAAIGQRPDLSMLAEETELETEQGNIVSDPETLLTSIAGVFAGGDCVTGAATAVEAIGFGRQASVLIDSYLRGEARSGIEKPFDISKGQLDDLVGKEEFVRVARKPREEATRLRPTERRNSFREVEASYTEDMAKREAERCMECGCKAADDCTLRELATDYEVSPVTVASDTYYYPLDESHPFIERDPGKCVSCERCARLCLDVQGIGALSMTYRVGTADGHGGSLLSTTCVSCGLCVSGCPVGALVAKNELRPAREVRTICPYCGVGCGIYLGVRGGVVVSARGDADNPVSKGDLCVKGRFGYEFVNHPDRLTSPLIKRNGEFVEATWDEALDLIANKLAECKGDRFATLSSAKCTNEENYVIQKFTRAVMNTNNIDHCARLCHAPSVAGLARSFGSGAMTNSISEIEDAACIFAIGSNTTESHPVIGLRVKKALQDKAHLIVANPRKIDLCRFASLWLRQRPGTDVALLMGMMRVIVDEELLDLSFIEQHTEGFDAFKESLQHFDLDRVERITGVPCEEIIEAARTYSARRPATILYSMGITQHSHGTDNVLAISNLALLTGNIGKPSTGVNPLRGQNNVQGACDMGALPNVYPGYQRVDDAEVKRKFETAWGYSLGGSPGLTLTEILEAAYNGQIAAIYIVGENPVLSEPDARHAREALEKAEFLVVQDIFLSETARLADVVLPAATFAEKDGTFTNTERRVQTVRKALEPVGASRPDWWITCQIAKRLGATGFEFADAAGIMAEIAAVTPSYKGISYERLDNEGLQWPCPGPEHGGTPILHTEKFLTSDGKARFVPLEYKPSAETPDAEYPLVLTTERSLYHYHTGTMTRRVDGLNILRDQELVELNPKDADALRVSDGETVRVVSRRGKVTARAKVVGTSPPGVVSMTFHFAESPTNVLTNPALDPVAKIPELKVCAIRIEKMEGQSIA